LQNKKFRFYNVFYFILFLRYVRICLLFYKPYLIHRNIFSVASIIVVLFHLREQLSRKDPHFLPLVSMSESTIPIFLCSSDLFPPRCKINDHTWREEGRRAEEANVVARWRSRAEFCARSRRGKRKTDGEWLGPNKDTLL